MLDFTVSLHVSYSLSILVHTALSLQVPCKCLLATLFKNYRNNLRPRVALASFISLDETPEGAGSSEPWIYNPLGYGLYSASGMVPFEFRI